MPGLFIQSSILETGIAILLRFFHSPSVDGTMPIAPSPGKAVDVVAEPLASASALPFGAAGLGQPPSE